MKNLINALKAENEKNYNDFCTSLDEMESVSSIIDAWKYKELLTKGAKVKNWTSLEGLKLYLKDRKAKKMNIRLAQRIATILDIEKSGEIIDITISVEWSKSRTWGNCPKSEVRYSFTDPKYNFSHNSDLVESGRITGCGYDKESTAVAQALNQIEPLLKAMYALKDSNIDSNNRDLFGYGSGYGLLPQFEGGVGVSCYPAIFEKIGCKFYTVSSGKLFDVYKVEKLAVLAV